MRKFRGKFRSIPLQSGLILIMIGLMFLGLASLSLMLNKVMRSYLLSRLDESLMRSAASWSAPAHGWQHYPSVPIQVPFFIRVENNKGGLVHEGLLLDNDDTPDLQKMRAHEGNSPFYVASNRPNHSRWRVVRVVDRSGNVYLASPLTQVDQTIVRLERIEVWVSSIVLLCMGLLGYGLIRAHLRPLKKVEALALNIASGDMSIRIPQWPPHTEVGRLSNALNRMLEEIQLSFAQKEQSEADMRIAADRSKQFLADASHELRTPLTSIRGFAELYRQGASNDPDWVLSRIEKESLRMSAIIEDLLLLARSETSTKIELEEVDMLEVVRDGVTAAKAIVPRREILIKLSGSHVPVVMGVRQRVSQIISNYLSNAINHTPDGTRIVVVIEASLKEVKVSVVDRGQGISEAEQAHVFERFYRTDSSRARQSGGSGLGLSIVHMFAENMGGKVGVISKLQRGSSFWLTLPRVEDAMDSMDVQDVEAAELPSFDSGSDDILFTNS